MKSLPAESPAIATRVESICSFFPLFVSRIYFVTLVQSSRPDGNGYSGAKRYLSTQILYHTKETYFYQLTLSRRLSEDSKQKTLVLCILCPLGSKSGEEN